VLVQTVLIDCVIMRGISSKYGVLVQTVLLDCVIKGEDLFIICFVSANCVARLRNYEGD
jgi:hypothetical protein